MTTVVATHAVGNMDTWLGGGAVRSATFANFCSGHRIFRHPEENRISIVFEDVDLAKMKAILSSPEAEASKKQHTVIEPIDFYVEVEGGA